MDKNLTMNAHKVSLTLTTDGEVTLKGLPFQAGETVEVIVLEKPARSEDFSSISDRGYLKGVETTLAEWNSEADEIAYEDL